MKRVGRSVVSAMTQTPASGPFALVTVPPRSLAPMRMAGSALGCAPSWASEAARRAPIPPLTMAGPDARIAFMSASRAGAVTALRTLRSEDCEHLVGVRDPRLQEHRLIGLALELGHRARQAEPVQELVVAAILRLGDGGVAPRRPVAVAG